MRRAVIIAILFGLAAGGLSTGLARAGKWDRNAVYAARVSVLKQAIAQRPNDPRPLVALAAFYLKPLAPRKVAAADGKIRRVMVPLRNERQRSIKDIYAVPWVFRGDPHLAWPLLVRALKLDPNNPGAIREMAMLYRMKHDLDRMRPYMEAALRNNPMDLDMCRLFLDHRTALARVLNDQAGALLTPRTWTEDRPYGRYRVTQYPSRADRERAAQLDRQAKDVRRKAIRPLHDLSGRLKNDPRTKTNPALKSEWYLATAIYIHWIGELDKSAGTAVAALRIDPTNLDALDYIIDTLRHAHTFSKMRTYKAILDRWEGVDSTPVIIKPKPRGPKL